MKRRFLALCVVTLCTVGSGCAVVEEPAPPNVLLISLDALRADHLSSAGYHRRTTPFLDELAAGGTRFSHASVNTHGTPSSHTTMLSSLYQETHRVWADPAAGTPRAPSIPDEIELLQEIFGRSGWTSMAVTGGGWMSESYGFARGFEHFSDEGRRADQGIGVFLRTLSEAREADRPVFAFFHTYQVHSPYLPPPEYEAIWGHRTGTIEPTSETLRPLSTAARQHLDAADFEYLVSQYDGEIRFLDDCLRTLFSKLEENRFLENAIVLVTADHGEEFSDHGGLLHRGTLYDELVRVPFIVWGRGVPAGVVDPSLVSTIDIAPTLLAAVGLDAPPAMEGRDVLAPRTVSWSEQRLFAQYRDTLYSIRTPHHKLIRNRSGRLLLFDLVDDPRERRNLATTHPELASGLAAELEAWRLERPRLGEGAVSSTEIDPATEERLQILGYLD